MKHKELTEFDLLIESHLGLERQGPGSVEMTTKALSFIDPLDRNAKVADIGCGSGGQTRVLAEHLPGPITGVDMVPDFIDLFNDGAKKHHLFDRVQGIVGDALELPFDKESFDLIWSEGMIDSIGFEKALTYWNTFLKKDGYVAVSSPSWLTNERPAEMAKFWTDAGSALYSVENNIKSMQKAGYRFVAAFVLPDTCWTENYFIPREAAGKALLAKYPGNKIVADYVRSTKYEVDLYVKHKQHYGYVFYIGKKVG